MDQAEHVLRGMAAIMWPLIVLVVLIKMGPELRKFLVSAVNALVNVKTFTVKIMGQEVTITQAIETLDDKLRTLQIVTTGIVTHWEDVHLNGLAGAEPYLVDFSRIMVRELERLDSIRYVAPIRANGINAIYEREPALERFNLKEYVTITPDGSEYLKLRAEILRKAPTRPQPVARQAVAGN